MRIIPSILFLGLCLWGQGECFLSLYDFKNNILPLCGNRLRSENIRDHTNEQELVIPNTIESFIGIVDKLEQLHPEWRPADVIKILLLNFRYDDATIKGNTIETRGNLRGITPYYEALIKLFKTPTMGQQLRDQDLSQDERCTLYYMISHTVNHTIREGIDETIDRKGIQFLLNLREQGVLTLSSQTEHAFALGKVLLGLLAGMERTDPTSALQVYKEVKTGVNKELEDNDAIISVLYAATFGDIVSMANEILRDTNDPIFYENGHWNEEVCPIHYFLRANSEIDFHSSYSLIRGAVDGYRLGSKIKDLMNSNSKLRLSQVLRMYYSGDGFPGKPDLSWCNRRDFHFPNLQEEATNFEKLYSALIDRNIDDLTIKEGISRILRRMEEESTKIYDEATRDGNMCGGQDRFGERCETPMNLLAIMDMRAKDKREEQSEIIGNVSTGMKFGGLRGSSASVYTNLKPFGGGFELDAALNNSQISGCGGCAGRHYDPLRSSYENEPEIFRDLNITLGSHEKVTVDEPGVASKVILYFNYGNPASDSQLHAALHEIRWRYRGAKLLAFGSRRETLRIFADDKDIETDSNPQKINNLKEKVCKVPAQFKYSNCYLNNDATERSNGFEGVITPHRVQYWMMDPKYFHRSFNIKLIFKALSGEIRVCHSRHYNTIFDGREPSGAQCHKSNNGEEVTFEVSNPCHRRSVENCEPFYFFIEGKQPPKDSEPCQNPVCRTLDQISYEFRHEGISCNSAVCLLSTKYLSLFWIAVTLWVLRSS